MDRIGRLVPAQAQGNNALSINQALNDPLVRAVYLPTGNIGIDTTIVVPDGKSIYGAGRNVTTITRRNAAFEGGFNPAIIRSERGARGIRVQGLSGKGTSFASKMTGIWLDGALDMVVEDVDIYNAGYAFFIQEYATRCLVRRCRSYNSNTDFEVTQGYDSTFEDCERFDGDGDNPILGEAWCIVHLGSRNITYRRIKGTGTGQPITVSANDVNNDPLGGLIDNILIDDCDFLKEDEATGILMNQYNNLSVGTVRIRNTRMKLRGLIGVIERGDLILNNCAIETTSQEGLIAGPGTSIVSKNTDVVMNAPAGANGNVYNATNAPIRVEGGSVTATTPEVEIGVGPGLSVSRETRFATPRKIYAPEKGRKVEYQYPVDVPLPAGTETIGAGTAQPMAVFDAVAGARYRLTMTGKLVKTGADGLLRLYLVGVGPMDTVIGALSIEKADRTFLTTLDGEGFGDPRVQMEVPVNARRGVSIDIEFTGQGGGTAVVYGSDGATLVAGARITIERLS